MFETVKVGTKTAEFYANFLSDGKITKNACKRSNEQNS